MGNVFRLIMPALQQAGVVSDGDETIEEYLKNNGDMVFITDHPTGLEETFVKYFSKEARIERLLECCRKAYGDNGDAKVGEQVHIIQVYAQNHWSEIEERLGNDAPNSWHYLTVKEILSNMGQNGWDASVKKYGLGKALEQLSAMCDASLRVRQEKADEKQQKLESLAKSGEPFWIKVKKGDITAKRGKQLFRSYRKKAVGDFPSVQVRHGTIVALKSLSYEKIPFGNNELVNTTYGYIHNNKSVQKLKSYCLKVPYGMLSHSDNGNVVLVWFSKKNT